MYFIITSLKFTYDLMRTQFTKLLIISPQSYRRFDFACGGIQWSMKLTQTILAVNLYSILNDFVP